MDTNRIIINNHDLSTASLESPTTYAGYTVVKAPKGPRTPVLIPAGGAAKMQDIFGQSSADYPELFEAELYNAQYSLYLSAPYFEAEVPVAYLTKKGFYQCTENIPYNDKVEYLAINGSLQDLEDELEGINYFPANSKYANVLKAVEGTEFIYTKAFYDSTASNRTSKGAALLIKIGEPDKITAPDPTTDVNWVNNKCTKALSYSNFPAKGSTFRLANLPFEDEDKNDYLNLIYPDKDTEGKKDIIIKGNNEKVGRVFTVSVNKTWTREDISATGASEPEWVLKGDVLDEFVKGADIADGEFYFPTSIENTLCENPGIYMILYGYDNVQADTYKSKLTTKLVASSLDEESERANLNLYKSVSLIDELNLGANDDLGEHIYAAIFPKYPSENTLHIEFAGFDHRNYKANSVEARNTLKITAYEDKAFHDSKSLSVTFNGSLGRVNGAYPAFNATNSGYRTQDLVAIYSDRKFKLVSDLAEDSLDMSGYGSLHLGNGTRRLESDKVKDTVFKTSTDLHNLGWEKATDPEYVDVDIFFESQRHYVSEADFNMSLGYQDSLIKKEVDAFKKANSLDENSDQIKSVKTTLDADKFFSLAKARQTSGFLFNYTVDPKVIDASNPDIQQYQLDLGGDNGRQYWNVCNELVVDLVDGSRFMSPLMGSRALMQTRIIEYRYGGVAPEWTNTGTPSMGGQFVGLTSTRLRFRYDKDQQDLLDKMNFNPVISDRTYGLMLTGHKTCQSGDLTDWSYIGHACSFLAFEKEARRLVMNPQLGKPNNPYYRDLRKFQIEELLAKRLQGSGRIWAYGDCDTSTAPGVNDTQALRAKQFRIKVRVKVDIYSEYVILDFYNLDQDTAV